MNKISKDFIQPYLDIEDLPCVDTLLGTLDTIMKKKKTEILAFVDLDCSWGRGVDKYLKSVGGGKCFGEEQMLEF